MGVGSWSPRRPGPCPTGAAPGARSSRGWLGGLQPQPRSPAALQCVGGRGGCCGGGGGAEAGAGLCWRSGRHFLLQHSVESPPSSSACPQRPRGPGRAWGITRGRRQAGWPRASPHCGSLFWDGGAWGLPNGADWLPWRPGEAWSGVEGAALSARPGPPFAESAAAVPAVWGMGRKGRSPSPGTSGTRGVRWE